MATVDFPNAPVDGQSYDYNGIRYSYVDSGGGLGFWQILHPGSYGIATIIDIDEGTDANKYITPLNLEGSKYVREDEADGITRLYHNNSTKLSTSSSGINVTGDVNITDDLTMSGISPALKIVSTDSGSAYMHVGNTEGGLRLASDADTLWLQNTTSSNGSPENALTSARNGDTKLYYNNLERVATKTYGAYIAGEISGIIVDGTNPNPIIKTSITQQLQITSSISNEQGVGVAINETGIGGISRTVFGSKRDTVDGAYGQILWESKWRGSSGAAGFHVAGKLRIEPSINTEPNSNNAMYAMNNGNSTTYSTTIWFASSADVDQGYIHCANTKIPKFVAPSDERLKSNITRISEDKATSRIMAIQASNFEQFNNFLKEEGTGAYRDGIIAQEYELIYPESVTTDKDDPFQVKRVKDMHEWDLVVAVQSAHKKIATLEERLEALEALLLD